MNEPVCPVCGSLLAPGAVFCSGCGSNLASLGLSAGPSAEPEVLLSQPTPASKPAVGPISAVSILPGEKPAAPRSQLLLMGVLGGLIVAAIAFFGIAILHKASQRQATQSRSGNEVGTPQGKVHEPDVLDRISAEGQDLADFNRQLDSDISGIEDDAHNAEAADMADTQAWAANLGLASPGGLADIDQALIYAAGFDDLPHLKAVLQQNPDLSAVGEQGLSAIHTAAFNGSRAALTLLIEAGANVNLESMDGSGTPLHEAAIGGDYLCCAILLRSGASLDVYDRDGLTPLLAAVSAGNAEAAQVLLDNGANVDSRSQDGLTALMAAAQHGQSEMLRMLLSNGADVSLQDPSGWTALHFAAAAGDSACINVLDSAGADHEARDMNGESPADVARQNGHRDAADEL